MEDLTGPGFPWSLAGSLRYNMCSTDSLALGSWNITSLGGKETELLREVERSVCFGGA